MKKFRISPTLRLTFGLVSLTISLILMAKFAGLAPDEKAAALEARQKLCEALAVQLSAAAGNSDIRLIRETLRTVVTRNDDMLSAALRDGNGNITASEGDHLKHWIPREDGQSTSTHVQVPIFSGSRRWGTVEISFEPLSGEAGMLGAAKNSLLGLVGFVALAGFLGYFVFLRRALRELDPTNVIPERVKVAFDSLAEGVLIMDEDERIVMANEAFGRCIENDSTPLTGKKTSALNWRNLQMGDGSNEFPWQRAIREGKKQIGLPLSIRTAEGEMRTFMVNGAPITDAKNNVRGALATFDDVTDLEKKNSELRVALKQLETSQSEVQRQNKELEFLAARDPLTGCLNRRSFFERVESVLERSQKTGKPVCCLMLDIDHFKSINDRYGHATGDKVIRYTAEVITTACRDDDLVCRYGGEEFCVILPGVDLETAAQTAERIREKVCETSRARFTSSMSVTISVGVSDFAQSNGTAKDLVNQADMALYAAKEAGRNRVVCASLTEVDPVSGATIMSPAMTAQLRAGGLDAGATSLVESLQQRIVSLEGMLEEQQMTVHKQFGYDRLTGLPNRLIFFDRVAQSIERCKRNDTVLAILYIDIDLFRRVNDAFGPDVGDQLLRTVADRIASVLRSSDTVALLGENNKGSTVSRLSNDEFAIELPDLENVDSVIWIVQRILSKLVEPIKIDGHEIYVTTSMGISVHPSDGDDAETLIGNARIARQHARQKLGNDAYVFYSENMNDQSYRQLMLESQMRRAIELNEFVLYYQPILSNQTGDVVAMEALIRWENPELGLVPPDLFIPIAERTGLIKPMGDWALRAACNQMVAWSEAGIAPRRVAVNISALQLRMPDFTDKVLTALTAAGLKPHQLELEITETALMQDIELSSSALDKLHGQGIHIAMDDFGTGYSSLSYLKRFKLDTLKIDRSFVRELALSGEDVAVVAAIVAMSHRLGIEVVAEGVETEAQLAYLQSLECDEVQGYLFSQPMPVHEADKWLATAQEQNPLHEITGADAASGNVVSISGEWPVQAKGRGS
ncbi:MAG: diguanylate cyclase [Gammaproteobacteria bacterium]|nr:diguanylate cyclase [Gammaproteobacteria bacterium]